jgi:hypothetical protein
VEEDIFIVFENDELLLVFNKTILRLSKHTEKRQEQTYELPTAESSRLIIKQDASICAQESKEIRRLRQQ